MERRCLITSLKDQSLRRIKFKENSFISEEIIFKGKFGRIRDIKVQKILEIFLCSLIVAVFENT